MVVSIVERIFRSSDEPRVIVVEDSARQSCLPLLESLLGQKSDSAAADETIIISIEQSVQDLAHFFSGEVINTRTNDTGSSLASLESYILSQIQSKSRKTIIFDSLTPLFMMHPFHQVARFIKTLSAFSIDNKMAIILPIHGDIAIMSNGSELATQHARPFLASVCTHYMTVRPSIDFGIDLTNGCLTGSKFSDIDAQSTLGCVCEVLQKKKSGKVERQVVVAYRKNPSISTISFHGLEDLKNEWSTHQPERQPETATPDPTANLSFNLKLTDAQKSARSEVALPYMQAQTATSTAEAAIYYEPDDDDYDEEDPDDDLDI
ncbi:Elongator complex protein 5 [Phlyctochytrium arcticum]|nr:Elongator complex protein 5 [Phlyctochytrium arcticum]